VTEVSNPADALDAVQDFVNDNPDDAPEINLDDLIQEIPPGNWGKANWGECSRG
jgi:hypothetical protein